MCGRFTLRTNPRQLALSFGVDDAPDLGPRFNVAPTQPVVCVRAADGTPEAVVLRWGLIPSWAINRAVGNRLVNARAETVAEKPAFRSAFKSRRCLILADGFYEWEPLGGWAKRPWFFRLRTDEPFAFAGLWESWRPADGPAVESCTFITGEPNALVAPVHDRMPVILPPERYAAWLDPEAKPPHLLSLLKPYAAGEMEGHPVSTAVNSPKNDGPHLVEPAG